MRKLCLTAVMAFAIANPASAQNWANKIFGGSPNTPVIQDFGLVARGSQLEATLKMTNIYKVPLNVTAISPSCNCVEAVAYQMVGDKKVILKDASSSGPAIEPNQTAFLNIKMDGTRWPGGPKQVNLMVTFGPQFISTAHLVVSANLRQDIVLNPGEIEFGSVQRGLNAEKSLDVECAGKPNWKVVQVLKNANAPFDLKSEVLPPRNINGAVVLGYRMHATLKPNAAVGPFRETVDLITNDDQKKITFIVAGTVLPPVTVAPNPVQVVGLKLGNAFNTKIVVTASQPFRITGVQNNGNGVNVTAPDRTAPTHVLDLNVTPTAPGMLNREIILQTDMRNETVKVIVQGNVAP